VGTLIVEHAGELAKFSQAFQVGIPLIGLNYAINANESTFLLRKGLTAVADLSHYIPIASVLQTTDQNDAASNRTLEQYTAHLYGAQVFSYLSYAPLPIEQASDPNTPPSALLFQNGSVYYYFLWNMNPYWTTGPIMQQRTTRYVSASSNCVAYDVIEGYNGNSSTIVYRNGSGSTAFDIKQTAPGGTTYITETSDDKKCGNRCTRVRVFQATAADAVNQIAAFFDCNVTVSPVNAINPIDDVPEQNLPDFQARIAAGAIGLNGNPSSNDTLQYQLYVIGYANLAFFCLATITYARASYSRRGYTTCIR
jgi:hypothetical protein